MLSSLYLFDSCNGAFVNVMITMKQQKSDREGQIRIVLNPKYKPKAEEILAATGLDNFSQLFSVLLVNYGDRLIAALKAEQELQSEGDGD